MKVKKQLVLYNVNKDQREKVFKVAEALGISIFPDTRKNITYDEFPNLCLDGYTNQHSISGTRTKVGEDPSFYDYTDNVEDFLKALVEFSSKVKIEVKLNDSYEASYKPGNWFVTVGCQEFPTTNILALAEVIKKHQ